MAIIIDGYNLLHASGILPRGIGPGGLERSRQALLNVLVESLPPTELPRTTVVFDASEAPWGVARETTFKGLRIYFAAKDSDADSLIEELILADSAPKRLTVVSSDHRLHKAAKRRKATPVDSDRWFAALLRQRDANSEAGASRGEVVKPEGPFSPGEVEFWLKKFAPPPETERPARPKEPPSTR
ncbi:MAG TPA: NYN domain-containing protein [Pirellulales bacterium]|jgi:hypothetical protein|nr:NYN domain-containing protein [Pirellulales bacterium]